MIKVEDLGAGDYARADPGLRALNRGKRSVSSTLKTRRAGRVPATGAARTSVLESFRPGVMDRLGVG